MQHIQHNRRASGLMQSQQFGQIKAVLIRLDHHALARIFRQALVARGETKARGCAIAVQPPHPHGALLLADYLLGPEGQGILEKYYYGNGAKNYGFKKWRPEHEMPLAKYEKELERWEKMLRDTGHKGSGL
jgi:hypothetical protein